MCPIIVKFKIIRTYFYLNTFGKTLFLGCDTMQSDRGLQTFGGKVLLPFSVRKESGIYNNLHKVIAFSDISHRPRIWSSSIDWAQLGGFYLDNGDIIQSPKRRVLNKHKMMDNVQTQ